MWHKLSCKLKKPRITWFGMKFNEEEIQRISSLVFHSKEREKMHVIKRNWKLPTVITLVITFFHSRNHNICRIGKVILTISDCKWTPYAKILYMFQTISLTGTYPSLSILSHMQHYQQGGHFTLILPKIIMNGTCWK